MSTVVLPPPGDAVKGLSPQLDRETRATKYWAQYLRSAAEPLLRVTGSRAQDQEAHLRFLDTHVAPALGPMPNGPRGPYALPYGGSPVEFTITSSTMGSRPKARVHIDAECPTNRGEGDDPFGQAKGREVLRRNASALGADTRWMESLISSLHLTPDETEVVRPIAPEFLPSQLHSLAFEGPNTVMRAYFMPGLKALAKGRTTSAEGLEAIRQLQPQQGGLASGVDLLEEFLNDRGDSAYLAMVGVDCIDPRDARVKIYIVVQNNSWDTVQDYMTLGGRLRDEQTLESLKILRPIYPLLRDEARGAEQRGDGWSKPDRIPGTAFSGLTISVELSPGMKVPEMKLHVPMYQLTPSIGVGLANYQKVLEKLGLELGRDGRFEESIKAIVGNKIAGVGYVSYCYSKKKGVYTSFYFQVPTLSKVQEWSGDRFVLSTGTRRSPFE